MDPLAPVPGQTSPDKQFVWNGSEWLPVSGFRWEPSADTRRMQLLAGGYLVVAGVLNPILTILTLPYLRQATEKALQQQNSGMTPDQIKSIVDFSVTGTIVVTVVLGLIYVTLGIMTLLRRRPWLFYADLVILGLSAVGVLSSLYALARGTSGPVFLVVPTMVLSLAALALFVWMLMTRLQGGVWASRKIPNTQL